MSARVERVLARAGVGQAVPRERDAWRAARGAMALACVSLALLLGAPFGGQAAFAAAPQPAWSIAAIPGPSSFSGSDTTSCENVGVCDSYTVLATNIGAAPTDGTNVTVAASVPEGATVREVTGVDWSQNGVGTPLECTTEPAQCVDERAVAPDGTIQVTVQLEVTAVSGPLTGNASVTGGGPAPAETALDTPLDAGPAAFGLRDFSFSPTAVDGSAEVQAGNHPYELTTSLTLPSNLNPDPGDPYRPAEQPKDVAVYLPPGFVGDPQATPRCPLSLLEDAKTDFNPESPTFGQYLSACPPASRIGVVSIESGNFSGLWAGSNKLVTNTTSVFNLAPEGAPPGAVPEGGHSAELGFRFLDHVIVMYADLVRVHGEYLVRVTIPGIPRIDLLGTVLTLFGEPGVRDGDPSATAAFLGNPTHCTSTTLPLRVELDSWERPGVWASTPQPSSFAPVSNCAAQRFEPEIAVHPETTTRDTPSGYEVDLKMPGAWGAWPVRAASDLKDSIITLPAGLSVTPAGAQGLEGCEETGPRGIDMPQGGQHPDEAGEGEAIGADGMSYLTSGHCPAASAIGEVEVQTPLLPGPLTGHLYLAEPTCGGPGQPPCSEALAEDGGLFGLYLEAAGSGAHIKLRGSVEVGGSGAHSAETGLAPGQVRTRFLEDPQVPFSELELRLNGGPRAPLANPQGCGTFAATTDFVPWGSPATADATPLSSFSIDGCDGIPTLNPSFSAGTVTPTAGAFSPFVMSLSRQDGEQDIAGITVTTPPGLLGMLSQVSRCHEPQASQGTCPETSRIGTAHVAVGSGSHPFWVTCAVYLTDGYKGAPFGLSVVVPAVAGPFNLGNVIVRAAIHVDPTTSALTVTSDPLPQMLDGVPLRNKTIDVAIDRPGFVFNPTNCSQLQVTGLVTGTQGASAPVASPFAVAGCKNLPFKPTFTALTQSRTSKASGASLHVKVTSGRGQANIGKVVASLPKQLPSRLTTLQKACVDKVFDLNPAACPPGSLVGMAHAVTPVLNTVLVGPAYLVSHGGEAFPDVVIVLQGEGITIDLDGSTHIKHGITSSTFNSLPDAPISSFDLVLPQGPHSALATNLPAKAKRSMCGQKLLMPTLITGQNGAVVKQTTKVAVSGCPKPKKHRHKATPRARHGH